MSEVLRGQVYWVGLDPVVGSEQGGARPAVVIQNDDGNRFSETTIVAAITGQLRLVGYPFTVAVPAGVLPRPSVVNCAHVRSIDKSRLKGEPIVVLDEATMGAVDTALRVSLGLR